MAAISLPVKPSQALVTGSRSPRSRVRGVAAIGPQGWLQGCSNVSGRCRKINEKDFVKSAFPQKLGGSDSMSLAVAITKAYALALLHP